MKKTIETVTARTTLGGDGIVRVRMHPNTTEDGTSARENIAALTEICGGKKRPLLIDMAGSQGATHDARLQYSGEAMSRTITVAGMLVTTPITKVVGRFFVSLNKPLHLLQLFSSEPEAVEWLRQYRQ